MLFTFTGALAKFNRYIAEIKAMCLPAEIISTVDGLFFRKLQRICSKGLASELENFLSAEGQADSPADASADPARPFPFREGPVPELCTAQGAEELQRLLREKLRVFLEEMGYDAENLCILVPRRCEIEELRRILTKARPELEAIREEQFSFRSTGKVRVCTLHSSKGLDFPEVLLYLPYLPRRKAYDDAQTEQLLRNLSACFRQ